ncbi:MAG: ATP synthase F1 subunit gamma [Thermonemataceae bacterium]
MASLKETRNRISSVRSTQQITKAMKMVAAAKLKRAQDAITQMRPYAQSLNEILSNLSANYTGEIESPYLQQRMVGSVLLIVVTSDRGLCGAFNSTVIKNTLAHIKARYSLVQDAGKLHLLCIGKRGYEYFKKRNYQMVGEEFMNIFTRLGFDAVKEAADFAMEAYANKTYDRVDIIYNEFKNVVTQILRKEQFLPVVEAPEEQTTTATTVDYILEPSPEEIITELIPKTLKVQLYKAILESNASEHGARMSAMDKATENAGELLKELKLTYNRSRQAAITKEILEIVGGAEALSQG